MVECESFISCLDVTNGVVLIDTWWNVNDKCVIYSVDDYIVLIDTWWNVNVLPDNSVDLPKQF